MTTSRRILQLEFGWDAIKQNKSRRGYPWGQYFSSEVKYFYPIVSNFRVITNFISHIHFFHINDVILLFYMAFLYILFIKRKIKCPYLVLILCLKVVICNVSIILFIFAIVRSSVLDTFPQRGFCLKWNPGNNETNKFN